MFAASQVVDGMWGCLVRVRRGIKLGPEGFAYPDSRCNAAIFIDQSAESIDADDCAVSLIPGASRLGRLERKLTMRGVIEYLHPKGTGYLAGLRTTISNGRP